MSENLHISREVMEVPKPRYAPGQRVWTWQWNRDCYFALTRHRTEGSRLHDRAGGNFEWVYFLRYDRPGGGASDYFESEIYETAGDALIAAEAAQDENDE